MDIELFSEMVKSLVIDNDEVTLPGLGTFVSEMVPSTFSDRGYTINPPYRRLSFRQRQGDGSALARLYSEANSTEYEAAVKIIDDFIADLKENLKTRKVVVFPGLGRLRATRENAFFFIPDEDLNIWQYGFGLEPVSLKTHEETPEEVSAAVADLRALVDLPAEKPAETPAATPVELAPSESDAPQQPVSEPEAVEDIPEPSAEEVVETDVEAEEPESVKEEVSEPSAEEVSEPAVETAEEYHDKHVVPEDIKRRRAIRTALIVLAAILAAALLFLGIFVLLAHIAPDFIDSLLYTKEELEIINY